MTDLRRRVPFPLNTDNVAGTPVSSDAASDGDALVYNSTTGYYDLSPIVSTNGGKNITGNKTFTGGFKVGADGTVFTEIQHGILTIPTPNIGPNAGISGILTFPSSFTAAPSIQLKIESDTGTNPNNDKGLIINTNGAVTVNSIPYRIWNDGPAATTGNLRIHWFAYVY